MYENKEKSAFVRYWYYDYRNGHIARERSGTANARAIAWSSTQTDTGSTIVI